MSDLAKKALELAGVASPAPWSADETYYSSGAHYTWRIDHGGRGFLTANVIYPRETSDDVAQLKSDANFVAFSREALPALAEEVMRLREALAAARGHAIKAGIYLYNAGTNNPKYRGTSMWDVKHVSGVAYATHVDDPLASKPEK